MEWRFRTEEELRTGGWIPQDEASELLGLEKGKLISWDYIEAEQTGADGRNWVRLGKVTSEQLSVTGEQLTVSRGAAKGKGARESRWVSVREAAGILGVCTATIYRDLKFGRLRGFRDGWCYMIPRGDVERLIGLDRYAELEGWRRRKRRPMLRPYRRDGVPLVSDEEFKLCAPYEYMALEMEKERIEEWRERFGPRQWDYAKTDKWTGELLNEKSVITAPVAMDLLGLSRPRLSSLIKEGKLMCIIQGSGRNRKALFSYNQVEALALQRQQKHMRAGKTPAEWAYDAMRPVIRTTLQAPDGDRLITTAEAAEILGVYLQRVGRLVKEGRLFGWQENPGRSRLYLSFNQVNRYAYSWDRLRRRAWRKGAGPEKLPENWVDPQQEWIAYKRIPPPAGKRLNMNHGDYFSTKQAARELGITSAAVHGLRKRGTLLGYHVRRPKTPNTTGHGLWWFFLKEDVWALKEDPQYAHRHRLAKQAHRNRPC